VRNYSHVYSGESVDDVHRSMLRVQRSSVVPPAALVAELAGKTARPNDLGVEAACSRQTAVHVVVILRPDARERTEQLQTGILDHHPKIIHAR
jgi:hypothetical protein